MDRLEDELVAARNEVAYKPGQWKILTGWNRTNYKTRQPSARSSWSLAEPRKMRTQNPYEAPTTLTDIRVPIRGFSAESTAWLATLAVSTFFVLSYLFDIRPGHAEPIVSMIVTVVAMIGMYGSFMAVCRTARLTAGLCALIACSQGLMIYFIKFHPWIIEFMA